MGYSAHMNDCSFRIPADKVDAARKAILENEDYYGTEAETLGEALKSWMGWVVEMGDDGSVVHIELEDGSTKITEEKSMFDSLAPFVEAGSFVEMIGEDSCQWRYGFDGEKCEELDCEIVWEPELIEKIREWREEMAKKR